MLQNLRESDNECFVNTEQVRRSPNVNVGLFASAPHICGECDTRFYPTRRVTAQHPAKFCSALCASRNAARRGAARQHERYPQGGAKNFNFKNWRSRDNVFYKRRFQSANPEKVAAHRAVERAVRAGKLLRPEFCESCLKRCRSQAHHDDYLKPLVVDWLCRACHRVADSMRREREVATA